MSDYSVFYVTPDPARGIGLERLIPNYHIICFDNRPIVNILKDKGVSIFSLGKELGSSPEFLRNAGKILEHPLTQKFIEKSSGKLKPAVMFFKPSFKIDIICRNKKYIKIGNSAELNRRFEDKIKFYSLCKKNGWPVPKGLIGKLKLLNFEKLVAQFKSPLVVQFGRGWAGSTTFFISSRGKWDELVKKWGEKRVKVTEKINGITYLNNACVTKEKILISSSSIQLPPISGIEGNPAATYGRQWPSGLSKTQEAQIDDLTKSVGEKMRTFGYKGWFGLDFLAEKNSGKIYISEDNARLTASTNFYTQMEVMSGLEKPMIYHHIFEFLDPSKSGVWKRANFEACQIVIRNFSDKPVRIIRALASGVYSEDNLTFKREGTGIQDLANKKELYLSVPHPGDVINPEIEIYTAEKRSSAIGKGGRYFPWVKKLTTEMKEKLKFENV